MSALALIRILRFVLPGGRMQQHLTDCAAYEVLDRAFKLGHEHHVKAPNMVKASSRNTE